MSRFSSLKQFEAFTNAEWEYFVQMKSSPHPVSFPNGLPYCLASQDLSDLQERSLPNRGWNIFQRGLEKQLSWLGVVAHKLASHTCTPGGGRDVRSAWSTQWVLGQPELLLRLCLRKGERTRKKERRKEPCCAQLEHSTQRPLSLCGTGLGYPHWSSLAIPAIRSFCLLPGFLTLTLPIHTPWLQALQSFHFL